MLPVCEQYGMGVIPWSPLAGGWLSGRYRKGGESPGASRRAQMMPSRYDMSLPGQPGQARGRRRARRSSPSEAGMTLIEMALAFVIDHPAVTAAIIGPRTMEQLESQLPALERTLERRRARPDRRDRPAGHERQPGRHAAGTRRG